MLDCIFINFKYLGEFSIFSFILSIFSVIQFNILLIAIKSLSGNSSISFICLFLLLFLDWLLVTLTCPYTCLVIFKICHTLYTKELQKLRWRFSDSLLLNLMKELITSIQWGTELGQGWLALLVSLSLFLICSCSLDMLSLPSSCSFWLRDWKVFDSQL